MIWNWCVLCCHCVAASRRCLAISLRSCSGSQPTSSTIRRTRHTWKIHFNKVRILFKNFLCLFIFILTRTSLNKGSEINIDSIRSYPFETTYYNCEMLRLKSRKSLLSYWLWDISSICCAKKTILYQISSICFLF